MFKRGYLTSVASGSAVISAEMSLDATLGKIASSSQDDRFEP